MVLNPNNVYGYPRSIDPWYEGTTYVDPESIHIGHKHHLCDLAISGTVTLDQMKALVKDAKFICNKCGRVAAKEENLCQPVPL